MHNPSAIDLTMSVVAGRLRVEVDSRLPDDQTGLFADSIAQQLSGVAAGTIRSSASNVQRATGGRGSRPRQLWSEPYLVANEGTAGPVLFMLPPGEGGAESYLGNLAKRLQGMRLILFDNVHLIRPMKSIEELAKFYVDQVRRIQPEGPYHILGWSLGGVVSLELGIQLVREGAKVSSIYFIDSYFDVRGASAEIGLASFDDILDPINYYYQPSETDLQRLEVGVKHVTLFRAEKLNPVAYTERQRRLYHHYHGLRFHNLERFLRLGRFTTQLIAGETHHSWVRSHEAVDAIARYVSTETLADTDVSSPASPHLAGID